MGDEGARRRAKSRERGRLPEEPHLPRVDVTDPNQVLHKLIDAIISGAAFGLGMAVSKLLVSVLYKKYASDAYPQHTRPPSNTQNR